MSGPIERAHETIRRLKAEGEFTYRRARPRKRDRYPYRWYWRKWPSTAWGVPGTRKGQRCRLLFQAGGPGPRNALVEFEDGELVVVTGAARRYALRRA